MEFVEDTPPIMLLERAVQENIINNSFLISEFSRIGALLELQHSDDLSPQDIWDLLQYVNHLDILPWKVSPTEIPPTIGLYTYSNALAVSSKLLNAVEEYLNEGLPRKLLFIGPRGSGKTHALGYFDYALSTHPDYFPIVLRLQEGITSGLDLLHFLLDSFSYQIANNQLLNEFDRKKIKTSLSNIRDLPPSKSLFGVTRRLIEQFVQGKKIVLIIERIARVFQPNTISEFFNKLLEYIDDPQGKKTIIITAVSLEYFVDSLREHPWGNFQNSYIQPFELSEITTWLAKRLRLANMPEDIFSTDAIRKIYRVSKGSLHIVNDVVQQGLTMCRETGRYNVDLATINKIILETKI